MIKGWLSFWSSCFPNFIHSWCVLYIRAGLPTLHCFLEAGGNACACTCVGLWPRDGDLQSLFASSSVLEKIVFSERLTKGPSTVSSPSSSAFPQAGRQVGAPASSGVMGRAGHLVLQCLNSSRRDVGWSESYFSLLFVIACSKLVG